MPAKDPFPVLIVVPLLCSALVPFLVLTFMVFSFILFSVGLLVCDSSLLLMSEVLYRSFRFISPFSFFLSAY